MQRSRARARVIANSSHGYASVWLSLPYRTPLHHSTRPGNGLEPMSRPGLDKTERKPCGFAVIGSGIAGLASAWLLSRRHEVTLYEANDYLGGHTHTHDIELDGRYHAVDTGFIVHNPVHYPLLTRLFDELGVASQPTKMSFSVHSEASGLQYNAALTGYLVLPAPQPGVATLHRLGARLVPVLSRGTGPAHQHGPGPHPGRLACRAPLRYGIPRRTPGADGVCAVVVAGHADPVVSGAPPRSVHGESPDVAGGAETRMARGAWRLGHVRSRDASLLAG
jgi:hypothetical protein